MAQLVKNLPAMWETWVRSLGWEDPLEKGKATHSMAWEFHGQSMRSQTVRGTEWLSLFTRLILYFLYWQFSYPQKKIFCQILSLVLIYLFGRLLVKKLKRILKNQGHCWAISGLFTIVCLVVVIKYGGSDGKESACDERLGFNSWVRKILWRREWLPNSSILAWSILWTEEPSGL